MRFTISTTVNASAKEIYQLWLSGKGHSQMTGSKATGSTKVNGRFTAWDGYIAGRNLELRPFALIIQAWRTTEFAPGQDDSNLRIDLISVGTTKTKVTLTHSNLRHADMHYKRGWRDHYFAPMKEYFAVRR